MAEIRDFYGRIIARVEEKPNGDKTVRDFYNNGFVGSYTLITPAGKELFRSLREKILEVE